MKLPVSQAVWPAVVFAAILCASTGRAAPETFQVTVKDKAVTLSADSVDVQGTPYVSLPALTDQVGGQKRVSAANIQVEVLGETALVGINDTRVMAARDSFHLQYPVIRRGIDILIAVPDVLPFFTNAFEIFAASAATTPAGQPEPETEPAAVPPRPAPIRIKALDEFPEEAKDEIQPFPVVSRPTSPSRIGGGRTSRALNVDTVIIDPGHGGPKDPGLVGRDGLLEKDLTLAIALEVRRLLKETTGMKPFVTRSKDQETALAVRATFANMQEGGLLVSIHAGSSYSPKARGAEIYCPPVENTFEAATRRARIERLYGVKSRDYPRESRPIADAIARQLEETAELPAIIVHEAPLKLFKLVEMPAVLIEVGQVTNPEEERLLGAKAYQRKLARGIAEGIKQAAAGAVQ